MFLSPAVVVFQNYLFQKNSFRNTISVQNSLDQDQTLRFFVWSDLGPNSCKGYQQTTLVCKELIIYRFQQIIERNITYGEVIKE